MAAAFAAELQEGYESLYRCRGAGEVRVRTILEHCVPELRALVELTS